MTRCMVVVSTGVTVGIAVAIPQLCSSVVTDGMELSQGPNNAVHVYYISTVSTYGNWCNCGNSVFLGI